MKLVLLLLLSTPCFALKVDPTRELNALLMAADRDKDLKITILDKPAPYKLQTHIIKGHYYLSNLLQELKLLEESKATELDESKVLQDPVERLTRSIRERYWDGLTRRIDLKHLPEVVRDPKIDKAKVQYLYVPNTDPVAWNYFSKATLKDIKVKKLSSFSGEHGLLTLGLRQTKKGMEGIPYVVPGGRFNEMYGWDSYFEALGLLADDRVDLAKAMVDNFVYQITHYGKILNANRTYYLTRSQPPFLTSMIRAVYERLPKGKERTEWLKRSLQAALKEYNEVWMGEERLTTTGLSRYAGFAPGIPPEVEPGHFKSILAPYALKDKKTVAEYEILFNEGKVKEPKLEAFFQHDRAVRESGHDTTYRWRVRGEDRCSDFVTVDLNSLLLKYEIDFALLYRKELDDKKLSEEFLEKAKKRREVIRTFLWDEKKNLFFDYNVVDKERSSYISATTFYPLWAQDPAYPGLNVLSREEARKLTDAALKELEAPGGVTATARASLELYGDQTHERQWEWPNGWAPHQMIIWKGLFNTGFEEDARRLTYKWLRMITTNARDYNGTVPEKYDVVKMSHAVFAEYGNVGTDFSYITHEGFGWMNASYQVGLQVLTPTLKRMLADDVPYKELRD